MSSSKTARDREGEHGLDRLVASRQLNHVSYSVRSVEEAVRFWSKGLGYPVLGRGTRTEPWVAAVTGVPEAKIHFVHLKFDQTVVEFIEYFTDSQPAVDLAPNRHGVPHICLQVDNIENALDVILRLGGRGQGEIATVTEGQRRGAMAVYARDSNGLIIELIEFPAESSGQQD